MVTFARGPKFREVKLFRAVIVDCDGDLMLNALYDEGTNKRDVLEDLWENLQVITDERHPKPTWKKLTEYLGTSTLKIDQIKVRVFAK